MVDGAKNLLTEAQMGKIQLSIHQKKRQDDLTKKAAPRKRLRPSGSRLGFAKEQVIAENERGAAEAEAKKERNVFMKIRRMKRNTKIREEIIAQREEKFRLRERKEFGKTKSSSSLSC